MALADYRLCDVCGQKAFYDANLNYEWNAERQEYTLDYLGAWKVICDDCAKTHGVVVVKTDAIPDPDATQAALREAQAREAAALGALRRLLDEIQTEMEGKGGSKRQTLARLDVAALNARAALASPSAAAAELLRRVEELEHELEDCGGPVHCKEGAAKDRADRDRWLGHVRALVKLLETPEEMRGATWDGFFAARRDLEQHDGGGK